jgi:DNA-directed RNA polymerase specialized sigma24 family protein
MTAATTTETFTVLYTEHYAQVRRVAARYVYGTDQALADDLTQEAFLRLWRVLDGGAVVLHPAGLLARIVRCAAADYYRLARNTREQAVDFADPVASLRLPPRPSAEDVAHRRWDARRLVARDAHLALETAVAA